MNNRELKKIVIEVPIYKYWFYVETDEKIAEDIISSYDCDYVMKDYNYSGVIFQLSDRVSLIYIKDKLKSVLNHEIVHLATRILNNGDTYDFRRDDESLCYVVEYLTKQCYNKLNIKDDF